MNTDIEQIVEEMRNAAKAFDLGFWSTLADQRRHIAASSPANVLRVLAALKEAQERAEGWRERYNTSQVRYQEQAHKDALELASLRTERDALAAERDKALRFRDNALECVSREQDAALAYKTERDALKAALEWYAEHVGSCRKNTSEGDEARRALDRDCGERARAALAQIKAALGETG